MISSLYNLSLVNNDNLICIFHGLQSVCNDEDGSLFEKFMHCLRNRFFRLTIQSTGRFIQDNNLWIFEKYFCNRESLFLSSTQFHSSLSNFGIESFWKFIDKFTAGKLKYLAKLFLRYTFFSYCVHKIFSHGPIKDAWFLREISYILIITFETCF